MARFDPFDSVSCKYGAPMGRRSNPGWLFTNKAKMCARHQGGGDGYDKGGAYWGCPSNVYAVWERGQYDSVQYVRASSKQAAIDKVFEGV